MTFDSQHRISRLRGRLEAAVGGFCALLLVLMVINVTWQVTSRYVLRSPSSFTEELARFLLIWLGLFGGAYALGRRQHVAIEALRRVLPAPLRERSAALANCAVLAFALVLPVIGGSLLVRLTYELQQHSAALGIRLAYVYAALPLAGLVMALFALCDLLLPEDPR
jgi:TRAP-type C4-dicarboxylate transport system permease small subunit